MSIKRTILSVLFSVCLTAAIYAQGDSAQQSCASYYKADVTFKKGKTKELYVWIDYCQPHRFQQGSIVTINEKVFKKYQKGKKVKKKSRESIKIKNLEGLTLEDGREFRMVKYVDLAATTKIGMLPKRFLLEVFADGDITVYRKLYRTKNGVIHRAVMDSQLEGGQQHFDFMTNNFEVLVQKDKNKNPRNIRNVNLKNYIGDKHEIDDKYINGDYTFRVQLQRDPIFASNCDMPFMEALLELVNDYNGHSNANYANTTFEN